jgi:hypothetical protein
LRLVRNRRDRPGGWQYTNPYSLWRGSRAPLDRSRERTSSQGRRMGALCHSASAGLGQRPPALLIGAAVSFACGSSRLVRTSSSHDGGVSTLARCGEPCSPLVWVSRQPALAKMERSGGAGDLFPGWAHFRILAAPFKRRSLLRSFLAVLLRKGQSSCCDAKFGSCTP